MDKDPLNEREFELINILGKKLGNNQRDLSRLMDLSLGRTNMLIRRLVSKGYIRIMQLNKKKVQYILTPKGIAEQLQKSVKYTLNTINSFGLIKDRVKRIVTDLHDQGHRKFHIYGESDFVMIVQMAFSECDMNSSTLSVIKEIPNENIEGILLIGKEKADTRMYPGENKIDLITELAKDPLLEGMGKS